MAFALMAIFSYSQTCGVATKAGTPCKRHVAKEGMKCYQHGGARAEATVASASASKSVSKSNSVASVQCEGVTKSGNRCKNRTREGNYCRLHRK